MKKLFFVMAAATLCSQLSAQDSTRILDEAIITANKFEQKQDQTGKVVTVITRAQLDRNTGKTLAQVLNEQAGISIAGALTPTGSVQTLFMRGASSGRALILVDGIPVSDPSMIYNEFDLNLFSVQDIERIEICKGAQSTLYGSDAIAGAINIITIKKESAKKFNTKATVSMGSRNTIRNNMQAYGHVGKLQYNTRYSKLHTDGFSSAYDTTRVAQYDRDGYDGDVFNTGIQYQLLPSLQVKTFFQYSAYHAAIDAGPFVDERDYNIHNNNLSTGAGLQFHKGRVDMIANYQYGELNRHYKNDSSYVPGPFATRFERNDYGARTQYVELYGKVKATSWLQMLAGGHYRWSIMDQDYFSLSSFGPYSNRFNDTSMHQVSVYGSAIASAVKNRLHIEIGARYNAHSEYGHNSTFTFNPTYSISDRWRVFGSIATGFKAPSIFQVFDAFSGNPDLKAEKSTNYETGVQYATTKLGARVVYFHRDIRNGIDYNNVTYRYFNFTRQQMQGIEFEGMAHITKQLSVSLNYTGLWGDEQTQSRKNFNDTTYHHFLRRPARAFNGTISYQFTPAFYAGINGKYVSSRYDVGGYMTDDVRLDGYFLLGANLEYRYNPHLRFFMDLQNITDRHFYDLRGYSSLPFTINGGISLQF